MVRAVIMKESGKLELIEKEKPEIKEGGILLKTEFSEVCGTDVHLQDGKLAGVPYPIIPGHVSCGTVEEVNGKVYDVEGNLISPGDKITFLDVHETCNSCYFCLVAKASTRCPKRRVYGITYSEFDGLLGGWSEYIYLKPGVKIIKIPDSVSLETFNLAGCGLPTAIHGIELAQIKLGDTVVVQGAGPVGLMSAILATISGAFKVIMIGAPEHRLETAIKFGIDHVINIDEKSEGERMLEVFDLTKGRGVDVTIECTGNPKAVNEGLKITRDDGTYVIVGQYTDAGDISVNPHKDINKKNITIKGSWGSDFSHFYKAVKFIEKFQDKLPFDSMITKTYSLEEAEEALNDVRNFKVMKALIKPN